jgi:predicted RecB family nuclease
MENNFTKRDFLLGLRCPKSLYLSKHNPELHKEVDYKTLLIMDEGKRFERVVQELIVPGGLDNTSQGKNMDDYLASTIIELQKKECVLYQATFRTPSCETVMCDILKKDGDAIEILECKMVTVLTETEIYDCSFQYHVLTSLGYKISKFSVAFVNKDYIREEDLTSDFISIKDVTTAVKKLRPRVESNIERFRKILKRPEVPEKDLGVYCLKPDPCPFKENCFGVLPERSIMGLKAMRLEKKLGFYYKNILSLEQLMEGNHKLTDNQLIEATCAIENKIVIQPGPLQEWFEPLQKAKGVFFMDFESVNSCLPIKGTKPFSHICTQYSLHYLNRITNEVRHFEFLADFTIEDPRESFIKNLICHLGEFDRKAPIVVFSAYETTRLRELSRVFPEYENDINEINGRIFDLMEIFRSKIYYDPRFKGSYSIKSILPVMCPALSYKDLEINNGAQAAYEYQRLNTLSKKEANKRRQCLLNYCKMDSYAMLVLLQELEEISFKCNGGHASISMAVPGKPNRKNKKEILN